MLLWRPIASKALPINDQLRTRADSIITRSMATGSASAYPHGLKSLSSPSTSFESALRRLGPQFEEVVLEKSKFVQPKSILYQFDGQTKRWDVIESHESVGIVLYHSGLHAFLVVRQFRPAVYAVALRAAQALQQPNPGFHEGFTFELCAGIVDKVKSLEQICAEEIEEECGYLVPFEQIRYISTAISSSGTAGARHHMYFAEVDESMRVTAGGGLQDTAECIEVLSLPFDNAQAFLLDPTLNKSPGLMFGLLWAYHGLESGSISSRGFVNKTSSMNSPLLLKPVLPA